MQLKNRLSVLNKDPDWEYRFIRKSKNSPFRIHKAINEDWEVCGKDEGLVVGDATVNDSDGVNSEITILSENEELVLMRKHKDYYNEDQKKKEKDITDPNELGEEHKQKLGSGGFREVTTEA